MQCYTLVGLYRKLHDVREFLEYYNNNFLLATITPKMHMLEDHAAQWIERWHFARVFMVNKVEKNSMPFLMD